MARMEMDKKWIYFLKLSRMNFFQIVKFDLEIFEILHKCCCNTEFLQEIAFFYLLRVFFSCYLLFWEHFLLLQKFRANTL